MPNDWSVRVWTDRAVAAAVALKFWRLGCRLGMGLGPILERHNVFQWDLATWRTLDAPLDAWCGYALKDIFFFKFGGHQSCFWSLTCILYGLHATDSSDSPLVQHLLTSWRSPWQSSLFDPLICTSIKILILNSLSYTGHWLTRLSPRDGGDYASLSLLHLRDSQPQQTLAQYLSLYKQKILPVYICCCNQITLKTEEE